MTADIPKSKVLASLRAACDAAGSQKSWAVANRFHPSFVTDILKGRREITDRLLKALGYERYEGIREEVNQHPRMQRPRCRAGERRWMTAYPKTKKSRSPVRLTAAAGKSQCTSENIRNSGNAMCADVNTANRQLQT